MAVIPSQQSRVNHGGGGEASCCKNDRFDGSVLTQAPFCGEQNVLELKVWIPRYCTRFIMVLKI